MAKADNTTRDAVKKEMAKPRISRSARIAELSMDTSRTPADPSTSMPGTVDKIIPPRPSQPEKAQITVEGADRQHRDLRIENILLDEHGEDVSLKKGTHVEVTVSQKPQRAQLMPRAKRHGQLMAPMASPLRYPVWQESYIAAMLETKSATVKVKIAVAKSVIGHRMVSSKAEPEERQAILDALNALQFLNRIVD
jgi:hypothetical protein